MHSTVFPARSVQCGMEHDQPKSLFDTSSSVPRLQQATDWLPLTSPLRFCYSSYCSYIHWQVPGRYPTGCPLRPNLQYNHVWRVQMPRPPGCHHSDGGPLRALNIWCRPVSLDLRSLYIHRCLKNQCHFVEHSNTNPSTLTNLWPLKTSLSVLANPSIPNSR